MENTLTPVSFSPATAPEASADPASSIGSEFRDYKPLQERYGIAGKPEGHVARNLQAIWDWALSKAETKDKENVLWEVTKLSNRLASPHSGTAPYANVLAWVSEYNRTRQSESRMKELEGSRVV